MSTLFRSVSMAIIFSFIFGCLLFVGGNACRDQGAQQFFSGPFCSVERVSTSSLLNTGDIHDAVLAQKFLLFFAVAVLVFLIHVVDRDTVYIQPFVYRRILTRFGPYQRRCVLLLPSEP